MEKIVVTSEREAIIALQKIENLSDKMMYASGEDLDKLQDEVEAIGNAIESFYLI